MNDTLATVLLIILAAPYIAAIIAGIILGGDSEKVKK